MMPATLKKNKYAVQILNQLDKPYWITIHKYSSKKNAEKSLRKLDKGHSFDTFRIKKLGKVI